MWYGEHIFIHLEMLENTNYLLELFCEYFNQVLCCYSSALHQRKGGVGLCPANLTMNRTFYLLNITKG